MLFWSETLLQWYEAESFNPHLIHLSDIVEYIDKIILLQLEKKTYGVLITI